MPTPKTYTPLSEIPGTPVIEKCSQILPNRCQCWRSGDFRVTETDGDKVTTYQLCTFHAKIQMSADQEQAKAENDAAQALKQTEAPEVPPVPPEPPKPQSSTVQTPTGAKTVATAGTPQEKILKDSQTAQTTQMPKGENSPSNT